MRDVKDFICIMENFLISNCYIDYNLQMFDLQQKHFMWKWNINGHMSKWHFFWVVLINQESIPIKISFEKQIAVKFKVTETLLNHFFILSKKFLFDFFCATWLPCKNGFLCLGTICANKNLQKEPKPIGIPIKSLEWKDNKVKHNLKQLYCVSYKPMFLDLLTFFWLHFFDFFSDR